MLRLTGKLAGKAACRIAAALVALTLSGVPRVLAITAPAPVHACACRAHAGARHACECATCRRMKPAAPADASAVEGAPPCHRAAARNVPARPDRPAPRDVPCLEGTCGSGSGAVAVIPGVEPFFLPAVRAVVVARAPEARPMVAPRVHERAFEPETPPPRAA